MPLYKVHVSIFSRQSGTPPSRTASRATLASLGSFSLQPLTACSPPLPREMANQSTKVGVSSVLEGLDPNFLNQITNLQSLQIDDLESALLPHLGSNSTSNIRDSCASNSETLPFRYFNNLYVMFLFHQKRDEKWRKSKP